MAKVLLVVALAAAAQPANQTFGGKYLFKLGDSAQITDQAQVEFGDVADGSYSASVQSLDTTGAPINDTQTCSVSVSTPTGAPAPGPAPSPAPAPDGGTYLAPSSLSATVTY